MFDIGLGGLVILALDIWAILQIVGSKEEDLKKVIWIVVIIALPLLGLIIWYFVGPKKKTGNTGSANKLGSPPAGQPAQCHGHADSGGRDIA